MADEENVVSSGEQQQTPAREKSSATLLDLVPMSVHLACIPFLFLIEGIPSIFLGLMIWLSFLAHRESRIPLREWIPFVGRCIDGTYSDRHPVIVPLLPGGIMFFGVEGSVFSITRFLPMTVINAVAFINALALLILAVPYIGATILCYYIPIVDGLPTIALAVATGYICEITGSTLLFFVYYGQSAMYMKILAGIFVGSAKYITVILILMWFVCSSRSRVRKLLDTTFIICGVVIFVAITMTYLSPDEIQALHEEQLMPQIMAMMNATFLYMFCMLGVVVYGIELDPIVIEDSALADKSIS